MARPGIMLYFDLLEPIRVLPDADKGRLLVAMLEYGQSGILPDFDGMLALAWGFVKPKIDRDSEEYARTVSKRQYATFCRTLKRKNMPEISYDEWMVMTEDERDDLISHDIKCFPTTTSTATATVTPTSTPSPTTKTTASTTADAAVTGTPDEIAAATAADKQLELMQGVLGRGVVALTDEQIGILLEKMGIELFDYYVDKLSSFIIQKGAKVKNHYATILKWWMEDSQGG